MSLSELIKRESPWIEKIIRDETWLCSERRGRPIHPDDPEIQERVCQIILRVGAELRARAEAA